MAVRRDGNQSGRRKKPASQGHPSRGGKTVGGGTKSKPTTYRSPTPSPPASQGHPSRGRPTVSGGTKKNPKTKRYKSPTPSLRKQRKRNAANRETRRALKRARRALRAVGRTRTRTADSEMWRHGRIRKSGVGDVVESAAGKGVAAGIDILEETTRPLHAVASAQTQYLQNLHKGDKSFGGLKKVLDAGVAGAKNERKDTYSDVLREGGIKNKTVQHVGGFIGDVVGDPLNAVSFGSASVARTAAKEAGEAAAKKAAKAGMSKAAQETVRRAAAKKAYKAAPKNKGITFGTKRRKTSGRTTARLSRASGVSTALRGGREHPAMQEAGHHLRPDFRRKGVPEEAHERVQSAGAEMRARVASGNRQVENLAKAYKKQLGEKDYQRIVDAIESGKISKLPEELRGPAIRLRSYFRHINRVERQAGVRAASRKNYVAHVRRQDVDPNAPKTGRAGSGLGAAKRRKIDAPLKELREESPDLFTEDIPSILAKRGGQSVRAVAVANFERELASTGRKLTAKSYAHIGDEEAIYHLAPGQKIRKVYPVEENKGAALREVERALETPEGGLARKHAAADVQKRIAKMRQRVARAERRLLAAQKEYQTTKYGLQRARDRMKMERERGMINPNTPQDVQSYVAALERAEQKLGAADEIARRERKAAKVIASLVAEREALKSGAKAANPGQYVILNQKLANDAIEAEFPKAVSGARRQYRKAHGTLKTLLTMPMPSYHLRNLYGDTANAWYEQSTMELANSLAKSAKSFREFRRLRKGEKTLALGKPKTKGTTVVVNGEKVPVAKLLQEAESHGGLNAGFSRDLMDLLGEHPGRIGKLRNIGEMRENFVRFATYVGARNRGLSAREAAKKVRELHFDYGDLTATERAIRDVIPFYTFTARNTVLQARKLVTKPGKVATYQKAIEEAASAAGLPEDWQQNLKDYQKLGVPLPAFGLESDGKKLLLLPGLPIMDLNRLSLNAREQFFLVAQMFTGFKAIPELIANYSIFFRGPIDDDGRLVAAPDWLHAPAGVPLPAEVQEELGLVYVYDKALDKKVWKYKAKWDYLLRQLPETSALFNLTSTGKNRRGQDKALKAISLTGVRPEPYDPLAVKSDKLYERQAAITRKLKNLNRQGVTAENPTKEYKRLLAQQKATQARIEGITNRRREQGDAVAPIKGSSSPKSSGGSWVDDLAGPGAEPKGGSWVDRYAK